jgi:hypothetical protein
MGEHQLAKSHAEHPEEQWDALALIHAGCRRVCVVLHEEMVCA